MTESIPGRFAQLGCRRTAYIGDGVYAGHDGCDIWLLTERETGIHEMCLSRRELDALNSFANSDHT